VTSRVAQHLETERIARIGDLALAANTSSDRVLASLFQLSTEGQVVYDFAADRFRYRPILPVALSETILGPEHPELAAGRQLAEGRRVRVERDEALGGGRRLIVFKAQETSCEAVVDSDLAFKKAKCTCSFFYKNGLRAGPCRHLVALRLQVLEPPHAAWSSGGAVASDTAGSARREARSDRAAPASGPASPLAVERSGPKREEVMSLLPHVAREMRAHASRTDKSLADVFQEAWDSVFERLLSQKGWKSALALVVPESRAAGIEHKSVSNPEQVAFFLHVEVLREIEGVAKAFGASPSAVVNLAWLAAQRPLAPPGRRSP
jgi:hypothetical protein